MRKHRVLDKLALSTVLIALLLAAAAGAARPLHRASGGGSFKASGNEFQVAFTAHQLNESGKAKGQFEFHNRTNKSILHMKIVYMEVDGDQVWLGGIVTKSIHSNARIGDERVVTLQDNGEGANAAPDKSSRLSNQAAYDALSKPSLTLVPLDHGNVQIR